MAKKKPWWKKKGGLFGALFSPPGTPKILDPAGNIAAKVSGATTMAGAKTMAGSIGQNWFKDQKYHDPTTGNTGQYSTPGGIGHNIAETWKASQQAMFAATPASAASPTATTSNFNPFAMFNFPSAEALASGKLPMFGLTIRNQPARSDLTGKA
jgi:hypothetical protein